MLILRAVLFQIFLTLTVIPYAIACLLWAPLPLKWRYKLTVAWPRLGLWGAKHILGLRWHVKGWENLPDAPAVILCKHQSTWETFFFPAYMPKQVCFVYKRELHRIPFFGWGLGLLKMIPIDRSKGRDAFAQVLSIGTQRLQEGRWPVLFPEGTRVPPGKMGRFKLGGARLACHAQVPVIPVAVNAGEFWPKGRFIKQPGLVTISFGPPIDSTGLTPEQLNQRVYDWIAAEMQRLNPNRHYLKSSPTTLE